MSEDHPDADAPADVPPASSSNPASPPSDPELSKELVKSAYNAFKKRWKLTQLDQESRIGRGPMSSGQKSSITGISPPDQFPKAVWDELVKQNRIKARAPDCMRCRRIH